MVNLDEVMDLSIYVYPVESQVVLENLRKKVTQLEAGIQIDNEKGRVRDRWQASCYPRRRRNA